MTASPRESSRWALWGVLALAVVLRLGWIAVTDVDPRRSLQWDMTFYDLAAHRFLERESPDVRGKLDRQVPQVPAT